MAKRIETFADIIAPVDPATFFAEHHDRKPLHVPAAAPDKFDDVMTWDILTAMLNMTAIWSPKSLQLVLDTKTIPPEQFCRQAVDRNGQPSLQPDAELVKSWLRRGASIVANDIDTLTPGIASAASALEAGTGGKVQSNLYCSWNQRQAFDTHFDTHEVFALHVAGEKVWRIYEGRLDHPIAHESFKSLGADYHHAHRGKVAEEVTLRPGDLLYIPRGQYHDALASSEGCIHLAFGVTHIIGVDVLSLMFEHAMADPAFRTNIPHAGEGPGARRAWLDGLAERMAAITRSDALAKDLEAFSASFHYPRGGFDLPADGMPGGGEESEAAFELAAKSLEVVRNGDRAVLKSARGTVPIPDALVDPVAWIVARGRFTGSELTAAFPAFDGDARTKLLRDLTSMKVIARV